MRHRVTGALAAVVIAASACSTGGGGRDSAVPASADPRVEPRSCEVPTDLGVRVTCSWLLVPENRAATDSATIRLAVAVIHSRAPTPAPDPVVQLAGGPGGSGIAQLGFWAQSPIADARDIIVYDQRGTGASEPSLDCPERDAALIENLGRSRSYDVERETYAEALALCRARLVGAGIDLDAYSTEASAADLADLRAALGIDEWNLYGISYGSRLALATMRSHPEGIRSAVLDSSYPPDAGGLVDAQSRTDEVLDAFFAACADDPACAALTPDLEATLAEVVERYNEAPIEGTADLGDGAGAVPIVVDGNDLFASFLNMLSTTAAIPSLPGTLVALSAGATAGIPTQVGQGLANATSLSEGVQLGVECADNGAVSGPGQDLLDDPGARAGFLVHLGQPYCDVWDVDTLPASFRGMVRSPIPTLVVVGTFDPVTPPADSEATAAALEHAVFVEITGGGHGVSFQVDCVLVLATAFIADPDPGALDTACADERTFSFAG